MNAAKRDEFVWLGLLGARVVQQPPLVLSLVVCFVFQTLLSLGLKPWWAILCEGAGVRHLMSNPSRVFDTTSHLVGVSFLVVVCHK